MIPNPPPTALIEAAVLRGCVPLEGLGMLVNQGPISIAHWTRRAADAGVMRATPERLFGVEAGKVFQSRRLASS